jgi:hypothetical protein
MHIDKLLSGIAFILNIHFWNTFGAILTPILTAVLIVYYGIKIYKQLKNKENGNSKRSDRQKEQ